VVTLTADKQSPSSSSSNDDCSLQSCQRVPVVLLQARLEAPSSLTNNTSLSVLTRAGAIVPNDR